MPDVHVRPTSRKLTDSDARHLLADGLLRSCHTHGPSRVAVEAGCDEKTIRRARDEDSTLGLAASWNLLDIDSHALDALAASKGVMIVPLIDCGSDVISAGSAAIHKTALARHPDSPGGHIETDAELIGMEAEADANLAAALALRSRINAAKLRRSSQ